VGATGIEEEEEEEEEEEQEQQQQQQVLHSKFTSDKTVIS
jgi:hypothetical protein